MIGAFDTCEICNNLDVLSGKKLSEANRAVLNSYRRVHIRMQAAERLLLERNIQRASDVDDMDSPSKRFFSRME